MLATDPSLMKYVKNDTIGHLLQTDIVDVLLPTIGKRAWETLYEIKDSGLDRFAIWCALLTQDAANRSLERNEWDLSIGSGRPCFTKYFKGRHETVQYERFGSDEGVRPLVLHRSFNDAFPSYEELDEEFRLYHNLAEDKARSGLLLSFDSSGRQVEVARIAPSHVTVRLRELRQFQAATGLHLAIYVDSVRHSCINPTSVPSGELDRLEVGQGFRWHRRIDVPFHDTEAKLFSRLLAKVILAAPDRTKAGVWPFAEPDPKKYVAFVISTDEDGEEVEHSCNPGLLGNYFGANPKAPNYLTPVHFRREVLEKYFAEPDRYTVEDGYLRCLSLWGCQIDNHHPSRVIAFLGDLGRDLPYEEQMHWRQFNIPPEGGMSETSTRRSFLGEFADAEAADLRFRTIYQSVQSGWKEVQGWPLFLEPSPGDDHLLDTVRIPVTSSQPELDLQLGALAKLLVDSLNEKDLAARAGNLPDGVKGIGKLEGFLATTACPEPEGILQTLRDIQALRSTGSAHRKGSGFRRVLERLGLNDSSPAETVKVMLERVISGLELLHKHYCNADPSNRIDEE